MSKYYSIPFSGMSLNYLGLFILLLISLVGFISSTWALASINSTLTPASSPTTSLPPTSYANTSRFVYFHGESMCTFDPHLGCAVGLKNVSGLVVLDKQTQQLYKVQPLENGLPLCSDPAYVVGALGSSCYDANATLTLPNKPMSPLE
jgi:hypothetical protein